MGADLNHTWVGGSPAHRCDNPSRFCSAALFAVTILCTKVKYFGLTPVITEADSCSGRKVCSMWWKQALPIGEKIQQKSLSVLVFWTEPGLPALLSKKGILCKQDLSSRQWLEYMLPWSGTLPVKRATPFVIAIRLSGFPLTQINSPKTKHRVQIRSSQSAKILWLESTGHLRNPDTPA